MNFSRHSDPEPHVVRGEESRPRRQPRTGSFANAQDDKGGGEVMMTHTTLVILGVLPKNPDRGGNQGIV